MTLTSSQDVEPCGGTVEFLDRYAPHVYHYWTGAPIPQDFAATVDLRRRSSEVNRGLQPRSGFAWVADQLALLHEMDHILVTTADGPSAPVFGEGVAEVLGPTDILGLWGPAFDHPESFAFLPRPDFDARHYSPAAKLMRSLIDRYGIETVRTAHQTADRSASAEQIENVFVEVFGDEIYDAFDEYMNEEHCSLQAWECSDTVVPVRQLPVFVDRSADCTTDLDFVGATIEGDDGWYPVQQFIVDLSEETTVRIVTTDNASVRKMSCLSSCVDHPPDAIVSYPVSDLFDITVFEVPWPAGRHSITVRAQDAEEPFSASIELAE